jgi:hypothetical protein
MLVCRLSLVSFALATALACGGSGPGTPLTGIIDGTFLTTSFVPKFGIAGDLVSPQDSAGAVGLQISDAPINCSQNLTAPTSAAQACTPSFTSPTGMQVRSRLGS